MHEAAGPDPMIEIRQECSLMHYPRSTVPCIVRWRPSNTIGMLHWRFEVHIFRVVYIGQAVHSMVRRISPALPGWRNGQRVGLLIQRFGVQVPS